MEPHILNLEGYTYRLLKQLAPYDSEMPFLMADKIMGSYVRTDIVVTPAVQKYIISRLEAVDATKLFKVEASSIRRCLLILYNIKFD